MPYLYLITDGNHYKIGVAKDPQRRLKALQTGNPKVLKLLATGYRRSTKTAFSVERQIHQGLKRQRLHGEWFRLTDRLVKVVIEQLQERPAKKAS